MDEAAQTATRSGLQRALQRPKHVGGTYDEAVAAVQRGDGDGIGYMLLGSRLGAIDLDHVIEDGKVLRWAEQLCAEANGTYQETTVSGAGLRIIGTVSGPETHRKFIFDRKTASGIEVYRNTARYITVSGLETSQCIELLPLDRLIDTLMARHGHRHTQSLDFNAAGPQRELDYESLIENGAREGERSELFQAVVWHLAGQGHSAEQIAEELARHPNGIGAKYADRLHVEVSRSYEKWRSRKRAAAGGRDACASVADTHARAAILLCAGIIRCPPRQGGQEPEHPRPDGAWRPLCAGRRALAIRPQERTACVPRWPTR
jgi:hypothetical protein